MLCSSNFYVEFEFSVVYCLCFDNKALSNRLKNTLLDYCFDIYGFLYSLPMHCTCRVIIFCFDFHYYVWEWNELFPAIHRACRKVIIMLFCFSLPCLVSEWNEDAEEKGQRSATMSGSSDNENTSLMAEQAKAKKKQPDWSRFGLSREPVKGESDLTRSASEIQDGSYQSLEEGKHNELYREDQVWGFIRFC